MVMTRKGFLEGKKTQRVGGEREHTCKGVKRMKWARKWLVYLTEGGRCSHQT